MIDCLDSPSGSEPPDFKKARREKVELADPARVDRLPPHSTEAAQGGLGCILLAPHECLGDCIERSQMGSEVFYDLRHRSIYEVAVEMYDKKAASDLITLPQKLKDRLWATGGLGAGNPRAAHLCCLGTWEEAR